MEKILSSPLFGGSRRLSGGADPPAPAAAAVFVCDPSAAAVATLCGKPGEPGHLDDCGPAARFNAATSVSAVSGDPDRLVVCDSQNHCIRIVNLQTWIVTTIAGSPGVAGHADGPGGAARFDCPKVAVSLRSAANVVMIADCNNHVIRRLDLKTGRVGTFAGRPGKCGHADGTLDQCRFDHPVCVHELASGELAIADMKNHVIRMLSLGADGEVGRDSTRHTMPTETRREDSNTHHTCV